MHYYFLVSVLVYLYRYINDDNFISLKMIDFYYSKFHTFIWYILVTLSFQASLISISIFPIPPLSLENLFQEL